MFDLADFSVEYAQKLGASYAEARLEQTQSNAFVLKNSNLELSGFDSIQGLGIRIIVNKALGFVSTNTLQKDNVKLLIDRTIRTLKHRPSINEEVELAPDTAHKKTYEVKQKINLNSVDVTEKTAELIEADKAILATGVKTLGRYLTLSDFVTTEYLVNSEGSQIKATVPRVTFVYLLTVQEGSKTMQRFWQYANTGGFEFVKKWDIRNIVAEEVSACSNNLKNAVPCPKKKMDVVAAPQVVGIMVHESCGHPYEADRILGREGAQAGESFITKEMLGTRIGTDAVTIVDDPTVENSYGFYLYDNEGVKARRKNLIRKGIINEFLHNRQTAALMGVASNGSSRAVDYDKESIVRMSNTFMLEGDHTEEELIEGVKEGVYMKNFMEWNIDDKRIHQKYVGAESYLIKNGKLGEPVRNPTLEISTLDLYRTVDAVAKNTEFHAGNCGKGEPMQALPVWFGGPSIRLRNIMLK
ncbi:MAG: TldD/PmbA family protein [Candidatus Woesearchaeota archaeon]